MRSLGIIILVSLSIHSLNGSPSSDIMVISPPSGDSEPGFHINAKSHDLTVRAGDTAQLTCGTSQDWDLCAFRTPQNKWCHRLSSSKYSTACEHDDRVRYQNSSPDRCSISIVDTAPNADSGTWTCLVRAHVLNSNNYTEEIEVSVATPYAVSVQPEQPVLVLGLADGNQTHEEVVCAAEGLGGAVDPVLEWQVNGERVEEHKLRQWQEDHSSGARLVYLALPLLGDAAPQWEGDEIGAVNLRCLSKQFFPNGTVIYESSTMTELKLLQQDDLPSAVKQTSDDVAETSNIAGNVIAGIILILTIVIIAFLLYSIKCKKFCYAPTKRKRRPISRNNSDSSILRPEDLHFQVTTSDSRQREVRSEAHPVMHTAVSVDLHPTIHEESEMSEPEERHHLLEEEPEIRRPLPPIPKSEMSSIRIPPSPIIMPTSEPPAVPNSEPPPIPISEPPFLQQQISVPSAPPQHKVPSVGSEQELMRMIRASPSVVDPTKGSREVLLDEEERLARMEQQPRQASSFKPFPVPKAKGLSESLVNPRAARLKRNNDYVGPHKSAGGPNRHSTVSAESLGVQMAMEPAALRGEVDEEEQAFVPQVDSRRSLQMSPPPLAMERSSGSSSGASSPREQPPRRREETAL